MLGEAEFDSVLGWLKATLVRVGLSTHMQIAKKRRDKEDAGCPKRACKCAFSGQFLNLLSCLAKELFAVALWYVDQFRICMVYLIITIWLC